MKVDAGSQRTVGSDRQHGDTPPAVVGDEHVPAAVVDGQVRRASTHRRLSVHRRQHARLAVDGEGTDRPGRLAFVGPDLVDGVEEVARRVHRQKAGIGALRRQDRRRERAGREVEARDVDPFTFRARVGADVGERGSGLGQRREAEAQRHRESRRQFAKCHSSVEGLDTAWNVLGKRLTRFSARRGHQRPPRGSKSLHCYELWERAVSLSREFGFRSGAGSETVETGRIPVVYSPRVKQHFRVQSAPFRFQGGRPCVCLPSWPWPA